MITVDDEIKELTRQINWLNNLKALYSDVYKGTNLVGNTIHCSKLINSEIDHISFSENKGRKSYWYAIFSKTVLNQQLYADPERICIGYFYNDWTFSSGYMSKFHQENYYQILKDNNFPDVLASVIDKRLAKEIVAVKATVENPQGSLIKYVSIM